MRAIAAILMMLAVAGCGPSRTELIENYEAELRELQRIEEKYDHLNKLLNESKTMEHSGDPTLTKMREEADAKSEIKLAEWATEIKAQKLRVEAARKAKDAAR